MGDIHTTEPKMHYEFFSALTFERWGTGLEKFLTKEPD